MADVQVLLVPGGGGSDSGHWHHEWASDPHTSWVHQADQSGGSRADWVDTIEAAVAGAGGPVVLAAHSVACIAVAHWAAGGSTELVRGALLVAPADVEDDWAEPDSLYRRFAPIPRERLPFRSLVVASSNDPLLAVPRARRLAEDWDAQLVEIGPHLHVGADADLGSWPLGRELLGRLLRSED